MVAPNVVVNLDEKFSIFDDFWSPKTVGRLNDLDIKVVKLHGEFVWHAHDDTDEFFLVMSGELTIQFRDREDVTIGPGEFYVVPRGVEHCPITTMECKVLLLEPSGIVNTGDATNSPFTAGSEWI